MKFFLKFTFLLLTISVYGQKNQLTINAELFPDEHIIQIKQDITYYNKSQDTLSKIILRNWANSYKNNDTPLAKRLLEDYKTDFYFSKDSDKGSSKINYLTLDNKTTVFKIPEKEQDLIIIELNQPLLPNESTLISVDYTVQIPNAKFTGNGQTNTDYFLSDWYITPAIYQKEKKSNTHKNLNYQHLPPTDFKIVFTTPFGFHVYSNFNTHKNVLELKNTYTLTGENYTHADLSINFLKPYLELKTNPVPINTNFISFKIDITEQKEAIQRMVHFLKKELQTIPNNQLLVEKQKYNRNPIYELKFLPDWLHPFSEKFKWEAQFFKALTTEYLTQTLAIDKNKDYWFSEGLEVYLFKKYMESYYEDVKIMGWLSKVWGVKSMHIAKQNFDQKFSIVHQITARENLDQSLNTPLDELSNFNKKVISPYKAGLGFIYLESFVGKEVFQKTITDFLINHNSVETTADDFLDELKKNSNKDISWFTKEWLNTSKKIDHQITKVKFDKDSVFITLKNKRSIKTPVLVYGLKGKQIKSKTWVTGFSNTKKVSILNDSLDKVVLNYESLYPEINNRNNWKNKKQKLFERPLQVKLLMDLNNPKKHQVFLKPKASYNFYDGALLGMSVQNKAFMHKNFEYILNPNYGTKSRSLTGGASLNYTIYPEKSNIYEATLGINGSNYRYQENLKYNTISPYLSFSFKQKNLRAIGTNQIQARFIAIDKEVESGITKGDEDQYQLFKLNYVYRRNRLVKDLWFNANTEIATKFTKLNLDFRYKHLTNTKRRIEFRFFGGVFLNNQTEGDYFSFNQHTPNDYLFELPYLGRSETSGILSQQYFKAQGGFVTQNDPGFANQWLTSINTSVGIWKWVETFNNVSLLKNRNQNTFFDVEGGIKLNFVPDLFELYLPVYNKEGWVVNQQSYWNSLRFTVTLKPQPLIKFLKQQVF